MARPKTDCLVVNTDDHHRLQTLKCTTKVVRMFTLEFVLDPFSVRRILNQQQNRTDALHRQSTLSRLGIIKCSVSEISTKSRGSKEYDVPEHNSCCTSHATISPGATG